MMEWLNKLLPEGINYWVILCAVLAGLNVYQYALAHKMSGLLDHFKTHGVAPEGTVIVSVDRIAPVEPVTAQTPTQTITAMAGGTLPKGWHMEPDIQKPKPVKRPWEK